ncbi:MAG: hypothetical protein HDP34_00115 [Clostridia bacterium]|nr:hypothetical protein [Clostridia bacterium]
MDDAIKRISILENALLKKGIIDQQEINTETISEKEIKLAETATEIDLENAGIKFCKECGYQLFLEDKTCPNCGQKIEDDENT